MPRTTRPGVVALVAARYELIRELRLNPETVDWEAVDSALDRPVVVQLLRPALAHDPAAVDRFWHDARAAARTPARAGERVLDAGRDPETGQLFVVREGLAAAPAQPQEPRLPTVQPVRTPRLPRRIDGGRRPGWLLLGGLVVVLALSAAAVRPALEGWLAWVNSPLSRPDQRFGLAPPVTGPASGAQPGQSTATAAPAPPTVAPAVRTAPPPTAVGTPPPTRSASATPLRGGQARRVVNTDGIGVALRSTPGGDRLPGKGYDEGATVQALEQSGEWTHIRGPDGREGWVLSVTLAP